MGGLPLDLDGAVGGVVGELSLCQGRFLSRWPQPAQHTLFQAPTEKSTWFLSHAWHESWTVTVTELPLPPVPESLPTFLTLILRPQYGDLYWFFIHDMPRAAIRAPSPFWLPHEP